ncbi:MAG: hypothetical protein PVI21_04420 [Candidatus Woesebacteria bacterium]|jgi:transcriptional repressor NrdR
MICPFCLNKKTTIYNSRNTKKLNSTWRRHRCQACSKEFTTYELIEASSFLRVATDASFKKTLPFSKTTLFLSIAKACDHRANTDDAFWLSETVEQKLIQTANSKCIVTTNEIKDICLDVLKNFDSAAFIKYLTNYTNTAVDACTIKRRLK